MTGAEAQRHAAEGVDTIIRIHDPSRLEELRRAVLSVAAQCHGPQHVIICTQRFGAEALGAVREAVAAIASWSGLAATVLNHADAHPPDARSVLANLGIGAARGRYLGFLDHDDVLLRGAHAHLVGRLRASGAAIAFGRTPAAPVVVSGPLLLAQGRRQPFTGRSLTELFRANFAPLHSWLLDRARLPEGLLRMEPMLTREEDYDLLLRLCAAVPADFGGIERDVGLYMQKSDGSNTLPLDGTGDDPHSPEAAARSFVEGRRRITLLAPAVQQSLWAAEEEPLTIRDWLEMEG